MGGRDPGEMKRFTQSRSQIYRLLAHVFAEEPQGSILRQLRSADTRQTLAAVGLEFSPAFLNAPEEKLLEDLAVEFTRLFLGPGRHLVPNESVQRGAGRFWGDHTVRVADFYARFGYQVDEKKNVLPDHLSVEFEFMGHLAAEEARRWDKRDEPGALAMRAAQGDFLREHLLVWAPGFCADVAAAAKESYFARFAEMARSVLESDSAQLGLGIQGPEENGMARERSPHLAPGEG
jgi:DMSO reductase family type II enzyme chaperone